MECREQPPRELSSLVIEIKNEYPSCSHFFLFFSFFFFFFYKNKIIFGNFIDMLGQVENFLFNDGLFIIEHGFFLPNKV